MRIRPFAVVVCLLAALLGTASAFAQCQAHFEPRRVTGAAGSSAVVTITPASVPPGPVAVAFSLDPAQNYQARGITAETVVSRGGDSGWEPVQMRVEIHHGASGEIPIDIIAEPLAEGQQPGVGTSQVPLPRAFTVAVEGSGRVDFYVASSMTPDAAEVKVPAGSRTPVKFVAMPRDGFSGVVRVTYETTCPTLSVVGSDGQRVDELAFNVNGTTPTATNGFIAAAEGSNGGQIMFTVWRGDDSINGKSVTVTIEGGGTQGGGGNPQPGEPGPGSTGGTQPSDPQNTPSGEMKLAVHPEVVDMEPGVPQDLSLTITRPAGASAIVKVRPRDGQNLSGITVQDGLFFAGQTGATVPLQIDAAFRGEREIELEANLLNTDIRATAKVMIRRTGGLAERGKIHLEIEPSEVTLNPDGTLVPIRFIVTVPEGDDTYLDIGQVATYYNLNLTTINKEPVQGGKQVYTTAIGGSPQLQSGTWEWYAATRQQRTTALLKINAGTPKPKGSLTVEGPDELSLAPGGEAQVRVHVRSADWNGAVRVVANASSAVEVLGDPVIELTHPDDVEFRVRVKTGATVGEGGHRLTVKAEGPDGISTGRHVIEVAITGDPHAPAADFTFATEPSVVQLAPGESKVVALRLERRGGWNGGVDVAVKPTDRRAAEKVEITLDSRRFEPGQTFINATVRVKPEASFSDGFEPSFQVTARAGGVEHEAYIGFAVMDKPIDRVSGQLMAFVNQSLESNSHVEGLSSALNTLGDIAEGQQSSEQRGLAAVYDMLISDLRNPSAFVAEVLGEETLRQAGLTPEDLDRMVWESGVLQRDARLRRADYQIASLGGFAPLFSVALDGGDTTTSTLSPVRDGQNVNWSECRTPIEVVVQQMRLARVAKSAAETTGFVDAVLKSIEARWDVTNTDMTPWPQLQAAMKVEAAIGCAISIADTVAKAIVAFMPNEITDFYAVINGQYLNAEGETPSIEVDKSGQGVDVRAELVTGSPGGEIKSPMEIALMVADRMLKLNKLSKAIDKLPNDTQRAAAAEIRTIVQQIVKRVQASVAAVGQTPAMQAWAASPGGFWKVPSFKNKPVVINTSNVLNLGSRSPAALQFRETGNGEFRVVGLSASPQAGYYVGLKKDLIADLQPVSKKSLVRRGVINVYESENLHFERCRWLPNARTDRDWVKDPNGFCVVIKGECSCPK